MTAHRRALPPATHKYYLLLDQCDAGGGAGLDLRFGPEGGLDFAYMRFLQQEHAQAALPYASAD